MAASNCPISDSVLRCRRSCRNVNHLSAHRTGCRRRSYHVCRTDPKWTFGHWALWSSKWWTVNRRSLTNRHCKRCDAFATQNRQIWKTCTKCRLGCRDFWIECWCAIRLNGQPPPNCWRIRFCDKPDRHRCWCRWCVALATVIVREWRRVCVCVCAIPFPFQSVLKQYV